jgi:hypothetical protein
MLLPRSSSHSLTRQLQCRIMCACHSHPRRSLEHCLWEHASSLFPMVSYVWSSYGPDMFARLYLINRIPER